MKKSKITTPTPTSSSQRVSVDIKKAKNGYVVSSWNDKGDITIIAKTLKEAQGFATKLLKPK